MANPFDEKIANRLVDVFKNLNNQLEDSLAKAEEFNKKEQENVDIAKRFNVLYKTRNEKFEDSLKNLSLQEKLLKNIENTESTLETLQLNRFNSAKNIENSQKDLRDLQKELNDLQAIQSAGLSTFTSVSQEELNKLINKINETQNLINKETDLLNISTKEEKSLQNQLKTLQFLNKTVGVTKVIMKELNIPTSFTELLRQTYDRFKDIDKTVTEIRQKFALFRSEGQLLENNIRNISVDLSNFGATATDVAGTMKSIGATFNAVDMTNKALVSDVTLLSKQMGISSDKSISFLKSIGGIKGQSGIANKNMLSLAGATAKAYGVGLDEVMSDVANASEEARMFSGKNADEMVRAAAQARQMGTTLDNMAKTASGLLDFESSIQSELKASALIGKNINFNEARRLAFQGKVVEANKMILDQAKKIRFNQLNPIAQEAFAKAAGKSVKELQDMLESESRIKEALNSQDPAVRKIAQERLKEQNLLKTNTKLAQQRFEQDLKTKANQERLAILQNKISQQLQKLMLPVLELITKTMDGIVYLFEKFKPEELIGPLIKVGFIISAAGDLIKSKLFTPFKTLGGYISSLGNIPSKLLQPFRILVEYISKLGNVKLFGFLKAGKIGVKAIPFLGEVILAIELIMDLWDKYKTIWSDKNLNIGQKIFASVLKIPGALYNVLVQPFIDIGAWIIKNTLGENILNGIKSVMSSIFETLKWPFEKAYDWIMDKLGGKSPSKIGLAILTGIKSIASDLYNFVTSPFISAFDFITESLGKIWEKIKGIGGVIANIVSKGFNFVGKIFGGTEETGGTSVKTEDAYKSQALQTDSIVNAIVSSNKAIADRLDKLTTMMSSGQIAVYIDGQRANQLLASTSQKFGSFGQATT